MQTESPRTRGNGFIVSDGGFPPGKAHRKLSVAVYQEKIGKAFCAASAPLSTAAEEASVFFDGYSDAASQTSKRLIKKSAGLAAFFLSAVILFKIFTVGEAVYINNSFIGASSSEEGVYKAVSMAKDYAREIGITNAVAPFSTVPVITLKNKLYSADALKDKLLLSSGKLAEGYTLISDGKAIYNAATYQDAKKILDDYIKSLSMNGDAKASEKVSIKKRLIASSDIKSNEECAAMLSASKLITVISVADTSFDKPIPYETQTTNDDSLYIGESVTVSEGVDGTSRVSQQTVYENGVETSVQVFAEQVTAAPVAKVVRVGTKPKNILESGLIMPLKGTLSSPFGTRWGRMHEGIDIAVPVGTAVKVAESGTVCHVSESTGGYGKFIKVDHGGGIVTAYAHLDKINVAKNQTVTAGETIALSGNTGRSTGPHLHFEVLKDGTPLNPLDYVKEK